ncbi:hypothetical protein L227DRAFT_609315 [Lentinus tigrinus ALCF2SS1-6]|uniref:Uncharacterized protein n=1 Tax=Lentinus tigrinus ALCF2SS1-6 TaxID=1328759 RepID=A0A5C2SHN8_9APHY|nr:hypothetical protein L227DRAFT_609315 [Lentinus tigrinus ALCF2SS1-6]
MRPRDLVSHHLDTCHSPQSLADFFAQVLLQNRQGRPNKSSVILAEELPVDLDLYVDRQEGQHGVVFDDPVTWSLRLRLDTRLATHGVLVVDLDRYKGVDDHAPGAPFWLVHAHRSWIHPLHRQCSLAWLAHYVWDILGHPRGRPARVLAPWWRILHKLSEAQDIKDPLPKPTPHLGRPVPRPRPLHHNNSMTGLEQAMASVTISSEDEQMMTLIREMGDLALELDSVEDLKRRISRMHM